MKPLFSLLQRLILPCLGLLILGVIYAWAGPLSATPSPHEMLAIQSAREAFTHGLHFYPTFNGTLTVTGSPFYTLLLGALFKVMPATLEAARGVSVVLGLVMLAMVYLFGARAFHAWVGALAAAFMAACWGFFSASHSANGTLVLVILNLGALFLFFDWFDSAFRSRTLARSLYTHFIGMGILLGLSFWAFGLPGILFPLLVMASTVFLSSRYELIMDIHYSWLLAPLGGLVLAWGLFLGMSLGFWPWLSTLFPVGFSFQHFFLPLLYLFPIAPLLVPAFSNKDLWSRALLSYQRPVLLFMAWLFWGTLFSGFFPSFGEAFALLAICPLLLWLGFYLSEVFRNPVTPRPLQWAMDAMVLLGFLAGVCTTILAFQLAPPALFKPFIMLAFSLTLLSMVQLFLREHTISRTLPFYVVPCALLLCLLVRTSVESLFWLAPERALMAHLPAEATGTIVDWDPSGRPPSRFWLRDPAQKVISVRNVAELEARIQTRHGQLYLVLPESRYYNLPESAKALGHQVGVGWGWKQPLTLGTLLHAVTNEMVDFNSLSEPVFLVEIPAPQPVPED